MTYPHLGSLSDSELDAWVEHNVTFINKCAGFSYVVSLLACCVFLVTAFKVPHIAMRFLFAQIVLLGVGEALRWNASRSSQLWVDEVQRRIKSS